MMVFRVLFEVIGKRLDLARQKSDLNLGRARIGLVPLMFLHRRLFLPLGQHDGRMIAVIFDDVNYDLFARFKNLRIGNLLEIRSISN